MTDEHLELYKKYRALKWSRLIGQEHVAKTITAALKAQKVPTAYAFFGPRGVGKTSSSWILAKAVNCENNHDENDNLIDPDPCNHCETCLNIDENKQIGVHYMSMANAGSVDDVRELVKKARNNPPGLRKQVFILDEFHNLSKPAFDSLLIPLESKEMRSLFIFCSTAREKIPPTILSRSQSRNFKLVDAETMITYLTKISKVEEFGLSEGQIHEAVKLGGGSVRDSLSALEGVAYSETTKLSVAYDEKIIEHLSKSEFHKVLVTVAEANNEGADFKIMSENMFSRFRDLVILASGGDTTLIGVNSFHDPSAIAKSFGYNVIIRCLDHLGSALNNISFGGDSRIHLEIALTKILMTIKQSKTKSK